MTQSTNSLRFKEKDGKRILQQMWLVTTVDNPGVIVKQHGRWRDIECVNSNTSDLEIM
jgi:hypothetical protein